MLPGRTYTPLDFAKMAWRRSWLMAGGLALGAYAALVVSSQVRDLYQSETLIQVVPQRVPDTYVQSTVTMRTEERLNALSQQVLSRTALEALINELDLYDERRARLPMQDIVNQMRMAVTVEPVTSSKLRPNRDAEAFYVRFTYPDPLVARRVTERLGLLFIELNSKDRGQLAQATNDFLESQLTDTRQQLEAQERKLEQFRQKNAGRLPTQLESNMQLINNTQLGIQAQVESLARDRDRKLMLERLFHDAEADLNALASSPRPLPPTPPGKPGEVPAGASASQQLALKQDELARLLLRLTPEHPDVIRAKRDIADLQARVVEETPPVTPTESDSVVLPPSPSPEIAARRDRLRQARAEIDSLERQIAYKEVAEKGMRDRLADFNRRIEEIPGVESEWVALTRDYKTQQEAYQNLLAKSEQSKVAVELERRQVSQQFRVLDPARTPVRPTGVNRGMLNAAGAGAGLALGVLLAALLEFRDRTFRSAKDIQDVLQLPLIARVPFVMLAADRGRRRRFRIMAAASVLLLSVVGVYGFWVLRLWKFVV